MLFAARTVRVDPLWALKKILGTWGARITWTTQREHAGQILRGLQASHDGVAFSRGWVGRGGTGDGGKITLWALINFGDPNTQYLLNMRGILIL